MLAHAMRSSLGFSGYYQLGVTQQVILADCLDRGSSEIVLPAHNPYGDALCRNGWLRENPSVNVEVRSYTIPSNKWQELQTMRTEILSTQMKGDVQRFRATIPSRY
jgi:hypothetical protein